MPRHQKVSSWQMSSNFHADRNSGSSCISERALQQLATSGQQQQQQQEEQHQHGQLYLAASDDTLFFQVWKLAPNGRSMFRHWPVHYSPRQVLHLIQHTILGPGTEQDDAKFCIACVCIVVLGQLFRLGLLPHLFAAAQVRGPLL